MKIGDPLHFWECTLCTLEHTYSMDIGKVWRCLKKENMSKDNRMPYCDCVFYCDSIKFIVLKNVPAPSVHHSFIYNS